MKTRKELRQLTFAERTGFIAALLKLKNDGTYDQHVRLHAQAMANVTPWDEETPSPFIRNSAHRGPAFLPWHREMLRRFEIDLCNADQRVPGLPYWNWTIDAALPDAKQSPIFDDSFLGGDGSPDFNGEVLTGPFAHHKGQWNIVDSPDGPQLRRAFGVLTPDLPTTADVGVAMRISTYDESPWRSSQFNGGFRNHIEGWVRQNGNPGFRDNDTQLHNRVHVWVGGSMLPGTSPNDPLFFLHHCFVDRLWAQWQAARAADNPNGLPHYLPKVDGPVGHRLQDPMFPWVADNVTPESLLDHTALGYEYDAQPIVAPSAARSRTFTDDQPHLRQQKIQESLTREQRQHIE